ncbi:MAG: hypothetical protein EOP84_03770 [Verrucomicrobiaceae bacterium]|nr:MAG: hypothetical protein EOP84_03770 [Verrucomicrobiaceae bacterium]
MSDLRPMVMVGATRHTIREEFTPNCEVCRAGHRVAHHRHKVNEDGSPHFWLYHLHLNLIDWLDEFDRGIIVRLDVPIIQRGFGILEFPSESARFEFALVWKGKMGMRFIDSLDQIDEKMVNEMVKLCSALDR